MSKNYERHLIRMTTMLSIVAGALWGLTAIFVFLYLSESHIVSHPGWIATIVWILAMIVSEEYHSHQKSLKAYQDYPVRRIY